MSNITLSVNAVPKGALAKEVRTLLAAVSTGDLSRLRKVSDAADARLHSAEVSGYQALFFRITTEATEHLVFVGTFSADEATSFEASKTLRVNPINGVLEIIDATNDANTADAATGGVEKQSPAAEPATAPVEAEASRSAKRSNVGVRLVADGHTPASLYQELGLSPKLSAAVMQTTTHRDLFRVLDDAPAWQREAFNALVVGQSIENIREELALGHGPDESLSSDEQLLAAARQPASQMEFAYTEDAADLREAIETADYGAWRIYLHPSQQQIATRWFNGPGRVFGGAGTGKTVVAVHRARNIALGLLNGDGATGNRIILTTYTRGLASSLKRLMSQLEPKLSSELVEDLGKPGIVISGIDAIASSVLRNVTYAVRAAATESLFGRGMTGHPRLISQRDELRMLNNALFADTDGVLIGEKRELTFLLAEWVDVVLPNRITTKAGYLRAKRVGRGVALNRAERMAVWQVLDHFRSAMAIEGRIGWQTHAALAAAVIDVMVTRGELGPDRLGDHILIDEAQDFHAGHWLLVRALVPEGPNDIFIAEDAHQRIYGRPLVLERFGITTRGRSRGLKLNYRTTAENLGYANEILVGETFEDSEGEVNHELTARSLRSGPQPQVIEVANFGAAMEQAIELIDSWQRTASSRLVRIGVLVRERAEANRVITALTRAKIAARESRDADAIPDDEVAVLTMHSAKGLEFTHVILLDPQRNLEQSAQVYGMKDLDESAQREAQRRERSLIYVASSRARDELVVLAIHKE